MAVKEKEIKANEPLLQSRPLWQRIIYPLVGIILVALGILLWLLPVIPGFPLFFVGLPLLFCFHPRIELLFQRYFKRLGHFIMKKIRKKHDDR